MAMTQAQMDFLSRAIFLPIILVLDAWIFQYLVSVYYPRRQEFLVCMLLMASCLVFATQIYIGENLAVLLDMNDISETSLQLTFIIQITMIGRAVSVKVKIRAILWFTYVAEGLVVVNWLNVLGCILNAAGVIKGNELRVFGNVLESLSFVFVLVFRFSYITLSMGLRTIYMERKVEFLVYLLLVIHEYPFSLLENATGVIWEFPQAICHRLLMLGCILLNVQQKTQKNSRGVYTIKSTRDSANQSVQSSPTRRLWWKMLAPKPSSKPSRSKQIQGSAKVAVVSTHQYQDDIEATG